MSKSQNLTTMSIIHTQQPKGNKVTEIKEVSGKPYVMPVTLAAKIQLNVNYKKEIGGFNYILGMVKKYGADYLALLNAKHLTNFSMDDIQNLKAAELSPFMSDKERIRANATNRFTMWQISTLINRYLLANKPVIAAPVKAAKVTIVKVAVKPVKAAKVVKAAK